MNSIFNLVNLFLKTAKKEYTKEEIKMYSDCYDNIIRRIRNDDDIVFSVHNLPKRIADVLLEIDPTCKFEYFHNLICLHLYSQDAMINPDVHKKVILDKKEYTIYQIVEIEVKKFNESILQEPIWIEFFKKFEEISELEYAKTKQRLLDFGRDFKVNKLSRTGFFNEYIHSFGAKWTSLVAEVLNELEIETSKHYSEHVDNDIVEQYEGMSGSLHSCMTGTDSRLTALYANNPSKVKLIRYKGVRFLLWTTDDGTIVVDRIYPNSHSLVDIIKAWAFKNKFVCRASQTDPSNQDLDDNSERQVTLSMRGITAFPYMDTFRYCDWDEIKERRTITLRNYIEDRNDCVLKDTDGNYYYRGRELKIEIQECEDCGRVIDNEEDANHVGGSILCQNCYSQKYINCTFCGDDVEIDDIAQIDDEPYCEFCAKRLQKCPDCGFLDVKSRMVEVGNQYNDQSDDKNKAAKSDYCKDCAKKLKELIPTGMVGIRACYSCGKDFYSSDVSHVLNLEEDVISEYICESCAKEDDDVFKCSKCKSYYIGDPTNAIIPFCPKCYEIFADDQVNPMLPGMENQAEQ